MRRYVVLVWYDGLGKGHGEVVEHYRTREEAERGAKDVESQNPECVAAVYELL